MTNKIFSQNYQNGNSDRLPFTKQKLLNRKEKLRNIILHSDPGHVYSISEFLSLVGGKEATIRQYIKEFYYEGILLRVGRGKYRLNENFGNSDRGGSSSELPFGVSAREKELANILFDYDSIHGLELELPQDLGEKRFTISGGREVSIDGTRLRIQCSENPIPILEIDRVLDVLGGLGVDPGMTYLIHIEMNVDIEGFVMDGAKRIRFDLLANWVLQIYNKEGKLRSEAQGYYKKFQLPVEEILKLTKVFKEEVNTRALFWETTKRANQVYTYLSRVTTDVEHSKNAVLEMSDQVTDLVFEARMILDDLRRDFKNLDKDLQAFYVGVRKEMGATLNEIRAEVGMRKQEFLKIAKRSDEILRLVEQMVIADGNNNATKVVPAGSRWQILGSRLFSLIRKKR